MSCVLLFKHFVVEPAARVLTVNAEVVDLGSRAFDLLLLLIQHRDRLVTKKELMAALWPGMVVEENNLQVHVSALRKVIGASAIATVQGRGYRFALVPEEDPTLPAAPPCVPARQLPTAPAGVLGRDEDLADLLPMLRQHALVTLVGAGGIGKTTLALQAAHGIASEFANGACWVDLAGLPATAHVEHVAAAVAQSLHLPASSTEQLTPLMRALSMYSVLLVLDNAEHLIDAVADCVDAIAQAAPGTRMLVTSQVPLRVPAERVFRLAALALPPPGTAAAQAEAYGAVALFAQQGRAHDRSFTVNMANIAAVLTICRHLDGVPLALKLASSRLAILSPDAIAARLGDSMRLLRARLRHVPDRQQTIEAALDWSYALLPPPHQVMLARLSVFVGGFPLRCATLFAEQDCSAEWDLIELLQDLTEHCLIEVQAPGTIEPRFRLPECTRQYAALQLERLGDTGRWQHAHARVWLVEMEHLYDSYWNLPDQQWLTRYEPDLDNMRRAFDACCDDDPALALRIIAGSGPFFLLLGLAHEARRRYAAVARQAEHATEEDACWTARYWLERSRLEWGISSEAMLAYAQRALALYRRMRDTRGVYLALRCAAAAAADLDPHAALSMLDEMALIEQPAWGARVCAQYVLAAADVHLAAGRLAAARSALETLLQLEECGFEAVVSAALSGLATLSLQEGDSEGALRLTERLLARRCIHRGNFLLHAHATAAMAWLLEDDVQSARTALIEFARASCLRNWEWLTLYIDLFALLAAREGRAVDAARIRGCAAALQAQPGQRSPLAAMAAKRTLALCHAALGTNRLAGIQASGAGMDAAAVCASAFGNAWVQPPAVAAQ